MRNVAAEDHQRREERVEPRKAAASTPSGTPTTAAKQKPERHAARA